MSKDSYWTLLELVKQVRFSIHSLFALFVLGANASTTVLGAII